MIIIVAGANDHLKRTDVISAKSLFVPSKYLAVTLESEFDGILAALEIAKQNNVTTIMNAAPARKDLDQGVLCLARKFVSANCLPSVPYITFLFFHRSLFQYDGYPLCK